MRIFFCFFAFFTLSCGRWFESLVKREDIFVPKVSLVFSIPEPQMAPEGRWWDFYIAGRERPHITFYNYSSKNLYYVTLDTRMNWLYDIVDDIGDTGFYPNIFPVNVFGLSIPTIVYVVRTTDMVEEVWELREAMREEELGAEASPWVCRTIKKWGKRISVLRAGAREERIGKDKKTYIYSTFSSEGKIYLARWSAVNPKNISLCREGNFVESVSGPDFSLDFIYNIGGEDNYLRYLLSPKCNPIRSGKAGFELNLILKKEKIGILTSDTVIDKMIYFEGEKREEKVEGYDEIGVIDERIYFKKSLTDVPIAIVSGVRVGQNCGDIQDFQGYFIDLPYETFSPESVSAYAVVENDKKPLKIYATSRRRFFIPLIEENRVLTDKVYVEFLSSPFKFREVILGSGDFPYGVADRDGNVHIAFFDSENATVNYMRLSTDYSSLSSTVDGGGGGYFQYGSAGPTVVVVYAGGDNYPVVLYFSQNTGDLRSAMLFRGGWLATTKLSLDSAGIRPIAKINTEESAAIVLTVSRGENEFKLFYIYVPLSP